MAGARAKAVWIPPTEAIELLKSFGDRFKDFSVPMLAVAKKIDANVKRNIRSRGDGSWAPLAESTIKRWGEHQPLRRPRRGVSGGVGMVDQIYYSVYPFSAYVIAKAPHAHLHDSTGREGHMPARPFMYIAEAVEPELLNILIDYLFKEFNE